MKAVLWGVNAQLSDNEAERFIARWPLVRCEDGGVAVTEGDGWDCETGMEISRYSEEQALGFATKLETESPVLVNPGELIAIAGRKLLNALRDLELMDDLQSWDRAQNGFLVKPCTLDEYEWRSNKFGDSAMSRFDEAVLDGGLKEVNEGARSALTVLLSTAKRPLEQTKRLLYYYLLTDADALRDALRLKASSRQLRADEFKAIVEYPAFLVGKLKDREAMRERDRSLKLRANVADTPSFPLRKVAEGGYAIDGIFE